MDTVETTSPKITPDNSRSLSFASNDAKVAKPSALNAMASHEASDQAKSDCYRNQLVAMMKPIEAELAQVEQLILSELVSPHGDVSEMLSYVADLGGKRLRPCLLLLGARVFGKPTEESIRLATVVELVHTATLVHDDVLDEAIMRRHKPTLHTRWSVPASVLIGDWLFTHAYAMANKGTSTLPGRWIADAAKMVCEGEIMQGRSIRNYGLSQSDYVRLLDAKTGALCSVSCLLGAWSTGAKESDCHCMQQYGLKLGTAFQIFDDWLDVWGSTDRSGKTLGTDLASFKPTLPALRALDQLPASDRGQLIEQLNLGDAAAIARLRQCMDDSDASDYTRTFAQHLVEEAIQYLDHLPNNAATHALKSLARAAIDRTA